MTEMASICQGVRDWLRNKTDRNAAITGLRKNKDKNQLFRVTSIEKLDLWFCPMD